MKRILLLFAAAALLLPACSRFSAYFNTFYLAKKSYARAERIVENSASDRLPPEAIKQYDKAIEQCTKVIQKGGGWWAGIDDALFLMGASYYGKRDYDEALRRFDELIVNYPESDRIPEALFLSGLSHHHKKNYKQADTFFNRIAEQYPDFQRRDEILFLVGEGYEDDDEDRLAIRTYERLLEEFPGSGHAEEALDRIGSL
ncbi:MAG: tetratricopeptide repeat protein, partial [Candidatus Eisenbacteria bacterium]|nr:tetratricopeptide repeat protein [Candidatus Eisenbacteria bacterium]